MKYALIKLSWDHILHVPVADLSKVLELLSKYPLVREDYDSEAGKYYTYLAKINTPSIELTDALPEADKRVTKQAETV